MRSVYEVMSPIGTDPQGWMHRHPNYPAQKSFYCSRCQKTTKFMLFAREYRCLACGAKKLLPGAKEHESPGPQEAL